MKCKYCDRGMMHVAGGFIDVYQCVGCDAITIKDCDIKKNKYTWYRKEPLSSHAILDEMQALKKEAKIMSEVHPSKDARFFADNVYKFLSEHFR